MLNELYTKGKYLQINPTWHEEDSEWKALQVIKIARKNNLHPKKIADVGCGSGGVLFELHKRLPEFMDFFGFEISPQAIKLCQKKKNTRLRYFLEDFTERDGVFDLLLVMDVLEHLEDYFTFLRKIKAKAEYKIFHIPLELSAQAIIRDYPLIRERKQVGHIHHFTKATALETLKDTGFEIIDYFYTPSGVELQSKSVKNYLMRIPRRLLFSISQEMAVRFLGGFSLMVLAK